jgi:hypothetical protein
MRNFYYVLIGLFFLVLSVSWRPGDPFHESPQPAEGAPLVVSVSSDGRYAVSSHLDNRLTLWDIKNRSKQVIAENANIYSAYFVKGRELFIWQDLDDIVYAQCLNGKTIKSFKHFPTYGHVMDPDLDGYIASDSTFNLYWGQGEDARAIKQDGNIPSFLGTGKLLNLSLSADGTRLLSAGSGYDVADNITIEESPPLQPEQRYSNYAGVVVWDLPSGRPLFKLAGNSVKTNATFSPDGQYVVSGCENSRVYVWNAKTGDLNCEVASLYHGILKKNGSDDYEKWTFDDSGLIPPPEDLGGRGGATLAIKFIDQHHYLRFLTYSPYAVLFHIDNPLPLKYLYLGRNPLPAVRDYVRNAAIDTAPDAGILVMGQQYGDGILVYRYDSERQELERVWVAE